ncbi:MAG: TRAP transporter substrate-binding protein [Gammaproteobacteria bacterium]|nr:TRAP transporter substrate-binding protein [Gammaproteobacteria bacterium]
MNESDKQNSRESLINNARPVWNNRSALVAIVTSFAVGLLASLALRDEAPEVQRHVGENQQQEQIKWRVPVAFSTNLPALGDNIVYVSETLEQASNGRVILDIFEPGTLIPPFSITEGVRDGKISAGYTWLGYDQGRIPATPLISAVPFGMEPWEYTAWYFQGDGKMLAEELYRPHNIHPILCGLISPETAGWFRFKIETLADIQGLKIRFAGLGGKVMERLGASVTMLPGGEIFQALEKGAIDATEFSIPAVDQMLGFDKVAKFNYFPGWHQTFTAFHLVVNRDVWAGMSVNDQVLIEMACTAGVTRNLARSEGMQGAVIEGFPAKGVTPIKFSNDILRQLQQITREVLADEALRDSDFDRIYKSQLAFMKTYKSWKDLAFLDRDF